MNENDWFHMSTKGWHSPGKEITATIRLFKFKVQIKLWKGKIQVLMFNGTSTVPVSINIWGKETMLVYAKQKENPKERKEMSFMM